MVRRPEFDKAIDYNTVEGMEIDDVSNAQVVLLWKRWLRRTRSPDPAAGRGRAYEHRLCRGGAH